MDKLAIIKARLASKFSDFIEFHVELNGISIEYYIGKDVCVYYKFYDFDMNKTFWTDSNGLEMQERILNYRSSYNFTTNQNVSSNYYPITSAIAMRDHGKQVTIITDRSVGGSAGLENGTIEIMQNRRLLFDDDKGLGEALNEKDKDGYGIKVNAKYYM